MQLGIVLDADYSGIEQRVSGRIVDEKPFSGDHQVHHLGENMQVSNQNGSPASIRRSIRGLEDLNSRFKSAVALHSIRMIITQPTRCYKVARVTFEPTGTCK